MAKILGENIYLFDKNFQKIKSKYKRSAWVKDQFMNPHETLHTPNETLQWFDDNNVEFLNLIPHYDISKNNLFQKKERPKISYLNNF